MNQLGSVTYLQGDSGAAERYFSRALPLQEKVLGRNHPEVATSLNNLARLMLERRDYRAALPLLQRAVDIQLAQRGEGGADLAFLYSNLGIALRGTGRTEQAKSYLERGLAIAAATKHRNQAPTLGELADIACTAGDHVHGQLLLAQARPLMATAYPNDPWRGAWLDAIRARCLDTTDSQAEAERLRRQAAPAILAKWSPASHFGAALRP